MEIAVGLPVNIPGESGDLVVEWAREAERLGFSGVVVGDRLVYGNLEALVTLGAVAATTTKVRLIVSVLVIPYRTNALLTAKQIATVDHLSGGRLTVGVGIGGMRWDFEGAGLTGLDRGSLIADQIAQLRSIWSGEPRGPGGAVGPRTVRAGGPPMLYGGYSRTAIRRGARLTDGYIGGGAVEDYARAARSFQVHWDEFGREGRPWMAVHRYYALGPRADDHARRYCDTYYDPAWAGSMNGWMVDQVLTTPAAIRRATEEFAAAGCDEMLLSPCSNEIEQVRLLADSVLKGTP